MADILIDPVKVDDNTLQITKKPEPITSIYNYAFLKSQITRIIAQRDRDNALRDLEIAEVMALIAEADKLGIV